MYLRWVGVGLSLAQSVACADEPLARPTGPASVAGSFGDGEDADSDQPDEQEGGTFGQANGPESPGVPADSTQPPPDGQTPSSADNDEVPTENSNENPGREGAEDDGGHSAPNCVGDTVMITGSGNVTASSVFESGPGGIFARFDETLSVDGDVSTSWFSAGPGEDGVQSTYRWYTQMDHCIDSVLIQSNEQHANPDFRQGYGFESVDFEVRNTAGEIVYSERALLEGTPDPRTRFDVGGRPGNEIRLTFNGHESDDCGGFAELVISGRAAQ